MPRWEEISSAVESTPAPVTERVVVRRRFGCLHCCGLFGLIFFLIIIWGVNTVARTGLVTVPLVSAWVFHPTAPSRVVTAAANTSLDNFSLVPGPNNTFTTKITEQELTQLLRQSLGRSDRKSSWQVNSAQIAVRADAVELSVSLNKPNTTVLLEAIPIVTTTGQLQLISKSAFLGSLSLPPQIVSLALDRSFNQLLAKQFATEPIAMVRTEMIEGALLITFQPKAAPVIKP